MNPSELYKAYAAVYDEDLREELLIEEITLIESIDELYDDELEEIVEDSIYGMLIEGYDIDEVEEIFEETFSEARVDMAARIAKRNKEAEESERSAAEARSRGASVVRKEKRAAAIGRVKDAVKKVASNIKSALQKTAKDVKSTAKEIKFRTVDGPAARYANDRGIGGPAPGLSARSKDPEKRRALRRTVLSDIASRAKAKLGRGLEMVRSAGERAAGAVRSSSDASQAGARAAGAFAKAGAKGLIGRAARAVSRGARDVARRMAEDVDLYNIIFSHLLNEGYADTQESAEAIMANMSEEWREEILDEANRPEREMIKKGLLEPGQVGRVRNLNRAASEQGGTDGGWYDHDLQNQPSIQRPGRSFGRFGPMGLRQRRQKDAQKFDKHYTNERQREHKGRRGKKTTGG